MTIIVIAPMIAAASNAWTQTTLSESRTVRSRLTGICVGMDTSTSH